MAWSAQLSPGQVGPDGRPTKRSQTSADLIDAWNASFLRPRGIAGVLYRGRERRSGHYTGTVDMHLPELSQGDVSDPSESEDSDEEDGAGGGGEPTERGSVGHPEDDEPLKDAEDRPTAIPSETVPIGLIANLALDNRPKRKKRTPAKPKEGESSDDDVVRAPLLAYLLVRARLWERRCASEAGG